MNKDIRLQEPENKKILSSFLGLNQKKHKKNQKEKINDMSKNISLTKKYIYHFGPEFTEGSLEEKKLLGNKGSNLAEMSRLGLQVPPGFTLTTEFCNVFLQKKQKLNECDKKSIKQAIEHLEKVTNKKFNDKKNPLLLSVRSGATISMPGMMDTILNLGLNEHTVKALSELCNDERFAWDNYRRFIQMYSSVVMKMNSSLLEVYLEDYKNQKNYFSDSEISAEEWKQIVYQFKESILQNTGQLFPEDSWEQLWTAISAVFKSWNNPRAVTYRKMNGENSSDGTAVNIQSMVFGNRGNNSATGVVFTRNPSTGEKSLFGEFLQNAQGEDIVAGTRTPFLIVNTKQNDKKDLKTLMPSMFKELKELCAKLERHYKFVQDIEFTIEQNKLWLLQTRNAKCNIQAQLKILFDLYKEGVITEEDILQKIEPNSLNNLLLPSIDSKDGNTVLAKGLPASPGGAIGKVVFSAEKAVEYNKKSLPVILVRAETSPEDINGMIHSEGILTLRGGMTSHAAVVARSMGRPCVVGCESADIDEVKKELFFKSQLIKEGDEITLDGSTGEILLGAVKMKAPYLDENFFKLMNLSDKYSKLQVRANAETPTDVKKAKEFGAKGLGLCRTEHMFFESDRINIIRKMILSESSEERQTFLNQLFVMQERDFYDILKIMSPYPITVRLLDPPLHEFLPHNLKDIEKLAETLEIDKNKLIFKIKSLSESNPMLGHRGCRLAITFPEIYLMQVKALSSAMAKILKEGKKIQIEVMIPLVCESKEFEILKKLVHKEIQKSEEDFKIKLPITIGAMIELPRACLLADELAKHADFFSFGTNDLSQTVFGFSRDDTGKFLSSYLHENILDQDPFSKIDVKGVGELMKIAITKARAVKKDIKIGLCGEQGGDPDSLSFFHILGLDYVSCSPYRIPIAKLAIAQCNLKNKRN
ncbi:MAG: pyruvate, phosphate dikinase [Bdellovibrionaceae bacterium]|nr:pyruvate, phosphate dikinase [Pseudobdellovibrionaceae bacterium]